MQHGFQRDKSTSVDADCTSQTPLTFRDGSLATRKCRIDRRCPLHQHLTHCEEVASPIRLHSLGHVARLGTLGQPPLMPLSQGCVCMHLVSRQRANAWCKILKHCRQRMSSFATDLDDSPLGAGANGCNLGSQTRENNANCSTSIKVLKGRKAFTPNSASCQKSQGGLRCTGGDEKEVSGAALFRKGGRTRPSATRASSFACAGWP